MEEKIRDLGQEVLAIPCDVTEDASVREMAQRAEAHFGKIDVLVNNAGYFPTLHPLQQVPDAEWDLTLRTNLTGAFYVSRAVLPGMLARRRGSIIMISSVSAKEAYPLGAPYSAAKAGLLGLTRALAAEAGSSGVRVNAICPGVVAGTEMQDKLSRELQRVSGQPPEQRLAGARDAVLLRKLPSPEDVAEAALFLASAQSALLTGQTIHVDGGLCFG